MSDIEDAPTPDMIAANERKAEAKKDELASIIRRAALIGPLGSNAVAVHADGGTVMLTPTEAAKGAQAVLDSDWLRRHVADAIRTVSAAWQTDDDELTVQAMNAYRHGGPPLECVWLDLYADRLEGKL